MIPYRYTGGMASVVIAGCLCLGGPERVSTLMPGMVWEAHSPSKDLIPIESEVGSSQVKGKGKEKAEMDKGKPERACSQSLTVSEYSGAFHGGEDHCFIYDWTDDEHRDSFSDQDIKECRWLTDRSYQDAAKGDLTE